MFSLIQPIVNTQKNVHRTRWGHLFPALSQEQQKCRGFSSQFEISPPLLKSSENILFFLGGGFLCYEYVLPPPSPARRDQSRGLRVPAVTPSPARRRCPGGCVCRGGVGGTPTPLAFQVHNEDVNRLGSSVLLLLLLLFSLLMFS